MFHKYLGCMVDEYLELTEMVGDKAETGRTALGACLQRFQAEIEVIGVGVFWKLIGSLVESGIMYGVEVWGCTGCSKPIEHVQLRAFSQLFGVGTLHRKVPLSFKMRVFTCCVGGEDTLRDVLVEGVDK